MSLPEGIRRQIATVGADVEHGASWLARAALRIADQCAESSPAEDDDALLADLRACADALVAARPGMAPVRHWLEELTKEAAELAERTQDVGQLRPAIAARARELAEECERAGQRAAENAAALLPAGSTIFTASFSHTILTACQVAKRAGGLACALIAESADPSGAQGAPRYGQLLASSLAGSGLRIEVIPDRLAPGRVAEAQRVWLGADSVLRDGSILNGAPSLAIARAARAAGRPVDVIAEAAKFDRWTDPAAVSVPAGMDRVPGNLIDRVITENGVTNGAP